MKLMRAIRRPSGADAVEKIGPWHAVAGRGAQVALCGRTLKIGPTGSREDRETDTWPAAEPGLRSGRTWCPDCRKRRP